VPLLDFSCRDFRCIEAASLSPHPQFTLVTGPNASGKTSLLEAIAYLGRGRSFRTSSVRDLVRHGQASFLLIGRARQGGRERRLGVQNGSGGLEVSIDGDRDLGLAGLAEVLPVQVVDPDVHELVGGAPEHRRRFMDWMAFHVEQDFLNGWRRARRALRQRNAALKAGGAGLEGWDREFVKAGESIDRLRKAVVEVAEPVLSQVAGELLGLPVSFDYSRGWPAELSLEEALQKNRGRDLEIGATQPGPHRAELRLKVEERVAKRLVSRGQQKLLAAAMILGSARVVADSRGRAPLLLLDDPAAELDQGALDRLMSAVAALETQVIATALRQDALPLPREHDLFHVERGRLRPA